MTGPTGGIPAVGTGIHYGDTRRIGGSPPINDEEPFVDPPLSFHGPLEAGGNVDSVGAFPRASLASRTIIPFRFFPIFAKDFYDPTLMIS
jgi:hypothetical protein